MICRLESIANSMFGRRGSVAEGRGSSWRSDKSGEETDSQNFSRVKAIVSIFWARVVTTEMTAYWASTKEASLWSVAAWVATNLSILAVAAEKRFSRAVYRSLRNATDLWRAWSRREEVVETYYFGGYDDSGEDDVVVEAPGGSGVEYNHATY